MYDGPTRPLKFKDITSNASTIISGIYDVGLWDIRSLPAFPEAVMASPHYARRIPDLPCSGLILPAHFVQHRPFDQAEADEAKRTFRVLLPVFGHRAAVGARADIGGHAEDAGADRRK